MQLIRLSEPTAANRRVFFNLVDATDNETAETGLTFSGADIKVSKNGGAAANMVGTAAEVAGMGGLYYYEFDSSEVNAVGVVVLYISKSGCNAVHVPVQVVSFDPYSATSLGLTNLANPVLTAAQTAAGVLDNADGVESGVTLRQAQRAICAMLVGLMSGARTGTESYRGVNNGPTRVTMTFDASGNRTSVSLNL